MARIRPSRTAPAALLAALAALGAAAPAMAADRCVAMAGCAPADTYTAAQLQNALAAAGVAGTGRVLIGPGTFIAPAGGFELSTAGGVEIVGSGIGTTVIQTNAAQAPYSFALRIYGASAIRDLTLRTIHPDRRPLLLSGTSRGHAIRVEGTAAATNSWGVFLEGPDGGPTLEDAVVAMAGTGATAVAMNSASTLRDATLTADRGIVASNGSAGVAAASRVRVEATGAGVSSDAGAFQMADSLVTVTSPGATGVFAGNLNNGVMPITMTLDRVTVAGTDGPGQTGVASVADTATGDTASVTVRDAIITGFGVPLRRVASPAGSAQLTTAFTNHAAAGVIDQNAGSGSGTLTEAATTALPVAFAGPGDFHLAPGSPLIDAGDPADTGTADLAGAGRPLDGDADGTARVDLGAFESPVPVPTVQAAVLVPRATGDRTRPRISRLRITLAGRSARLRARISESGTLRIRVIRVGTRGSTLRVVRVRRPGPFGTAFRLPLVGGYRISVVARDAAGNASPTLRRAVTLVPPRRPAAAAPGSAQP